jgi:protocatechuate 3,4-dioxygenase beta subunit
MRYHRPKPLVDHHRRELLLALGSSMLAGQAPAQSLLNMAISNSPPACTVTPEQTEGPYFLDTRLHRADIRTELPEGSVKAGVPLTLRLRVQSVNDNNCVPVAGAVVDVWHCDADGVYSGVGAAGTTFLRGYQTTDSDGNVQFKTIYPGRYPGRTVHIHFKVRTEDKAGRHHEFTSQLYFEDAVTKRVHARMPYAGHRGPRVTNDRDGLFRNGGRQLMLALAQSEPGPSYAATFEIGLRLRLR